MFKNIPIPPSFSLVKKGQALLLLKEEFKEFLLRQGIEEVMPFLAKHHRDTRYMKGRTDHPSVPIGGRERMVVRRYSHGGLLGGITKTLYLSGARSFQELALTEEIRACGIPTIQPIGAIHQPLFPPFYRAYLLSLEIPHALNLIEYFERLSSLPRRESIRLKRETVRKSGRLLGEFHQAGFYHADLQLKNLLVAGDKVLLIDFDRSCRKEILSAGDRVKNLLRLNRSAEKWKRSGLPLTRTDRWRFLTAYAGGNQNVLKELRKALRKYSIGLFFHRIGWRIVDMVRS